MQRQMIMDESQVMLGLQLKAHVEAFNLRAIVEDTTATLLGHKYMSRGVGMHYSFSPDLPTRIASDPRWVLSMTTNYLSNALQHAQRQVVLRASLVQPQGESPGGGRERRVATDNQKRRRAGGGEKAVFEGGGP